MAKVAQLCDFCKKPAIYDGKTLMGPWAFMCEDHFEKYGYKMVGMYTKLEETIAETKKRCTNCKRDLPLSEYYRYVDKRGNVRYRTECKECNLMERKKVDIKKHSKEYAKSKPLA